MAKKNLILSEKLPPMRRGMTYSHAIKVGNIVYVSGQVARDKQYKICHKRNFLGQIEMVFQNMKEVLEEVGATMQDVVKLNFYCRHLWDLRLMPPVFEKYFGDHVPTMTAVEVVQLWHPHILVECEAVAHIGEDMTIVDGKEIPGVKYGKPYEVPGEEFRFE
jgi:enamine deaminase RidA (YjgF/YER057c/UK114 family)